VIARSLNRIQTMSIARKLHMLRAGWAMGRSLRDRLTLWQTCLRHGGIGSFTSTASRSLRTPYSGAPELHYRDTSGDAILLVEVLIEEDYQPLRAMNLQPQHILDIGANIGLASFFLRQLYPTASIVGFEPSDAEATVLARNYAAWSGCTLHRCAVGDKDGSITFAVDPTRTGGQHIATSEDAGWQHIEVPLRRIDSLIAEGLPVPDLVKMDIEGGELDALDGFGAHLSKPQAYIMETHSPALHAGCIERLAKAGYRVISDLPRPGGEARVLLMAR
jgi:FkbM family methyltransferase